MKGVSEPLKLEFFDRKENFTDSYQLLQVEKQSTPITEAERGQIERTENETDDQLINVARAAKENIYDYILKSKGSETISCKSKCRQVLSFRKIRR